MAARKAKQQRANTAKAEPGARSARLKQISKSSSQIVKDAAVLLDEELASGIVAAKQVQQRFQKERRINPGDFKDALTRFQGDAHDVVNLLNDSISPITIKEVTSELARESGFESVDDLLQIANTAAAPTCT